MTRNQHRREGRTRIVCTIGPATSSEDALRRLVDCGMDVARLNFSHGTQEEHRAVLKRIRSIAGETDRPIAVLQDLAGPKVRTGDLADGPVRLQAGQRFVLTRQDIPGDEKRMSVTYKGLPDDVGAGDTLLLNDGAIELAVREVAGDDVVCEVVVGGPLGARKGINLPSGSLRVPFLTDKDRNDLRFGRAVGVDYVALSFVRSADDVRRVRDLLGEAAGAVPLIAKIEKHEALGAIDAILAEVDGLMVARGDLGVEIPLERVPRIQKELIAKANQAAKPVITATQMLKSMVDSPRPTRAEATDVANAILDGSDAVMLSEETAVGSHPFEAVRTMDRIAWDVEEGLPDRLRDPVARQAATLQESVARAACQMAADVGAQAIVTCTVAGSTSRHVVRFRPRQPVLALTPGVEMRRRLNLLWGCVPLQMRRCESLEDVVGEALEVVRQSGYARPGDTVVLTAGLPLHVTGTTNTIEVLTVPEA